MQVELTVWMLVAVDQLARVSSSAQGTLMSLGPSSETAMLTTWQVP